MAETSKTKSSTKVGAETKKITKKATKKTVEKPKKQDSKAVVGQQEVVEVQDNVAPETTTEEAIEKELSAKAGLTTEALAKAGKRSPKALKEAEEKIAKEARKSQDPEQTPTDTPPKQKSNPTRPRIERKSKKFREVATLIDKTKLYDVKEAVALAIKTSTTKFDSTIELHVRLNVDPKQADQNIRESLVLPEGTGKQITVYAFVDEKDADSALKAGAKNANSESIINDLDKGLTNFDILIATPGMMIKLGKYAKLLGPKGLMPNPKSGSVTNNVAKAVKEAKAGKIEYRVDSTGIIHTGIGKVSFGEQKILNNTLEVLKSIKQSKPASVKGTYIKSIYLSTTMGPAVQINTSL